MRTKAATESSAAQKESAREAGLAQCLRLLGDDNRLRMFALLTKAELCVCEIEDLLGLSQSLVSNHLAALSRSAGSNCGDGKVYQTRLMHPTRVRGCVAVVVRA